jgi:hypothetical protein
LFHEAPPFTEIYKPSSNAGTYIFEPDTKTQRTKEFEGPKLVQEEPPLDDSNTPILPVIYIFEPTIKSPGL